MRKFMQPFALIVLLAFIAIGCSTTDTAQNPASSDTTPVILQSAAKITFPPGATFQSATLYIYCIQTNGEPVNVHRITSPWEEMVVTWNSFGGAYDPMIYGTFAADVIGWKSVDVSGLVTEWIAGTYENYGLLLDQVEEKFPWAIYNSREAAEFQPYLEVTYMTDDGDIVETDMPLGDAYIYETMPDLNTGNASTLRTGYGYFTEREKQSLLIFEIPEQDTTFGCTRTIGYWKTHAGFGPQADVVTPLLPVWLGTEDGAKSMFVGDAATAVDLLSHNVYGTSSNGITKLYAQLLAAKLNIINEADGSDVSGIISDADEFLAEYNWMDWDGLSKNMKKMVLRWMNKLDEYNNGIIGPGHCYL